MVLTENDFRLQTIAEKNGTPAERDLTIQTLAEKNSAATGGTRTQGSIIG